MNQMEVLNEMSVSSIVASSTGSHAHKGGLVDVQEQVVASSPEKQTHIHDLAEDCLLRVLSLVGDQVLPIRRRTYREISVHHPLQCALVCKRWWACARAAVRSLSLEGYEAERGFAKQAVDFTGLRRLRLSHDGYQEGRLPLGHRGFLQRIAAATPGLEHLELDFPRRATTDLLSALGSWSRLKELHLSSGSCRWPLECRRGAEWRLPASLAAALSKMTAVESLSLEYSDITWERLGPHMGRLNELGALCTGTPPPSMAVALATIPRLNLKLRSLPHHFFQFRNILRLHLVLFEGEELPTELGSMAGLENLTIEHMMNLRTLPDSIGRLRALQVLKVKTCCCFTHLPESVGDLGGLRTLHLVRCENLETLPESLGRLTTVKELCVEDTGLVGLPKGLAGMRNLERLQMRHNKFGWDAVPDCLGELALLTMLDLESEHVAVPDSVGGLGSLRHLRLSRVKRGRSEGECSLCSEGPKDIPNGICQLRGLESMEIFGRISHLPGSLGQLSLLTRLHLYDTSVRELPSSVGELQSLRVLNLLMCHDLVELPPGMGTLGNLRELRICHCKSFGDRANVIPRMKSLRYLEMVRCGGQVCLPYGLEDLTELQLIRCSQRMVKTALKDGRYPRSLMNIMQARCDFLGRDAEDRGAWRSLSNEKNIWYY